MLKTRIYTGQVLVLGLVQFIESIAFSIPSSYYPNYVIGLGATVASIGVFSSSFMTAEAILSPKMGELSDTYGRKRIIRIINGVESETTTSVVKVTMSSSFKVLLVYSFVNGIGAGFIMPIMVLFYNDKFGLEPIEIGLIMSISGFVGLFTSYVAGLISDRAGRKPLIGVGSFLSRLCGIILPLIGDVTQAAIVLSVRSLGFNINGPALRALRADITPVEARGRYFGLFRTAMTAGDVVGPIISTYIYDLYRFQKFEVAGLVFPGYAIPFFVNSALGIAATTILLVLVEEPKHSNAQPE